MPPALPDHVVVLLHGIRTEAPWAEMVRQVLTEAAPGFKVIPLRYGYFDVFHFLSPIGTRKRPAAVVVRRLRVIKEDYPGVPISVIAHSFGTYTLARILDDETDIKLRGLVLCGSIIPQDYRWDKVDDRIAEEILNDCGSRDVWPVLAKAGTWGFGPSGTFGFGHPSVRDRFHDFTHSDFFDAGFVRQFWVPYLVDGTIVASDWEVKRPTPPWWLSALRLVKLPVVALVLLALLVGLPLVRDTGESKVPLVALVPGFGLRRNLPPETAQNPSTIYSLIIYHGQDTLRVDDFRGRIYFTGGPAREVAKRLAHLDEAVRMAGLRAYFSAVGLPEARRDDQVLRYLRNPGYLDAPAISPEADLRFEVLRHHAGAVPESIPVRVERYATETSLRTFILELKRP